MTAVRPPARFGEIYFGKNNKVKNFKEKPNINSGWINGGFFVLSKEIFHFLGKNQMFERQPIAKLVKKKKLFAFKHKGFWQCMDTKRDKDLLEKILKERKFNFNVLLRNSRNFSKKIYNYLMFQKIIDYLAKLFGIRKK